MSSGISFLLLMVAINKGVALKCYKCNYAWQQPSDGLNFTEQFWDPETYSKYCMSDKPPAHLLKTCPSFNSEYFSYCMTTKLSGDIEGIVRGCETISDAKMRKSMEEGDISPNSCGETKSTTIDRVEQIDCLCNTDGCYGDGNEKPPKVDTEGKPVIGNGGETLNSKIIMSRSYMFFISVAAIRFMRFMAQYIFI